MQPQQLVMKKARTAWEPCPVRQSNKGGQIKGISLLSDLNTSIFMVVARGQVEDLSHTPPFAAHGWAAERPNLAESLWEQLPLWLPNLPVQAW